MTGDELRAALAELGWKQSDLCRKVSMGKNTVSGWAANGAPDWVAEYLGALLAIDRVHAAHVRPMKPAAAPAPAPAEKQKRMRRAANLVKKVGNSDLFADVSTSPAQSDSTRNTKS